MKRLVLNKPIMPCLQGFSEIDIAWKSLQLDVKEYTKAGALRGYVIAGVDEIMQTLDDSALSLQSMGASRFAAPFIEEIHKLEKCLSQVSEVLEA